jgi:hypothetical protein
MSVHEPSGLFVIQQLHRSFREPGFSVRALCCKTCGMSSDVVIRKKRGRPRSGQIPVFSLRLQPEWQEAIDEWRSQEQSHPSRSEAVRMLLAMALCAAADERKRLELDGLENTGLNAPRADVMVITKCPISRRSVNRFTERPDFLRPFGRTAQYFYNRAVCRPNPAAVCSHAKEQPDGCSSSASRWL